MTAHHPLWQIGGLALAGLLLCGCVVTREPLRVQRDNVLGTSFEMEVVGRKGETQQAVAAALREIARLEDLLSTWRDDSELSAYNAGRIDGAALSVDVAAVLDACEHWRSVTSGAFSCRLGALIHQWREAEQQGHMPDRIALRKQARALTAAAPAPDSTLQFDVAGVAKGYILDQALAQARAAAPGATGMRVDIGGDALHWGRPAHAESWDVAIADPLRPVDNGEAIAHIQLQNQAVAASGHRSRGYRIGRRQFSHVLDPQNGWPLNYAPSAVVVANDAATADALATALTVMPIRSGLALVDRLDDVAALVISDSGIAFASARWPALLPADAASPPALPSGQRIVVDYEIPTQDSTRYRQPYLAIWVEREDGSPVRQLLVLGDRARWLGELPLWWRHYGRNDPAAVHGLARPTRNPGHYTVAWDGRDDYGHAVARGTYLLRIEAAREHGGHDQRTIPVELGGDQRNLQHEAQGEIGRIVVHYDTGP